MWIYEQLTGKMFDELGELSGVCYSGFRDGKNNPQFEMIHSVGPIPRGMYTIKAPRDTNTHGPFVLTLVPDDDTEMYGREGFLIHGDSIKSLGTASLGCIVASRDVREKLWFTGDRRLKVVSGTEQNQSAWT